MAVRALNFSIVIHPETQREQRSSSQMFPSNGLTICMAREARD